MPNAISYSNADVSTKLANLTFVWFSEELKGFWRDENKVNRWKADCEDWGTFYPEEQYFVDREGTRIDGREIEAFFAATNTLAEKSYKKTPDTIVLYPQGKRQLLLAVTDMEALPDREPYHLRFERLCNLFIQLCATEDEPGTEAAWSEKHQQLKTEWDALFSEYLDISTAHVAKAVSDRGIPYEVVFTDLVRILNQ